jgi:hypothetical protein
VAPPVTSVGRSGRYGRSHRLVMERAMEMGIEHVRRWVADNSFERYGQEPSPLACRSSLACRASRIGGASTDARGCEVTWASQT